MSIIDDIVNYQGGMFPQNGEPTERTIERTAYLSGLLNQIHTANSKDNDTDGTGTERESRRNLFTVNVDADYDIPVVYGQAYLGGVVTDAKMTNNCLTMWYCITICERTGDILESGTASKFTIEEVYWDSNSVRFQGDGSTVDAFISPDGVENTDVSGLISIYFYGGDSNTPLNGGGAATSLMPGWTANHNMSDLVFALVKIDYSPENYVTRLGNLKFKVVNTMNQPGDVLYDYMTNTRYGAGIDPEEINGL
jgi:hypothetical protein